MIYTLSTADIEVLREVVKDYRARVDRVRSRPGAEMTWGEGEDHQSPEVYIALPQDTITAATVGGTPAAGDTPGSGLCDIYEIVDGALVKSNHDVLVYNLSTAELSGSWLTVKRDKYGSWLAVTGGGSNSLNRWGRVDGTIQAYDGVTVSVYEGPPNHSIVPPTGADETDTGDDVQCLTSQSVIAGMRGLILPLPSIQTVSRGTGTGTSELFLNLLFQPFTRELLCHATSDWSSGANLSVEITDGQGPTAGTTVMAKAPNIDGTGMSGVPGYIFPLFNQGEDWQFVPLGCSGTTGTGSA